MQAEGIERDAELVAAIGRRDEPALAAVYDRYASTLFALCLRILSDRPDAEETLTDVFWELWRRPQRYDPGRGNLAAYLITLTRSRAIDRLRGRRRGTDRLVTASTEERPNLGQAVEGSPLDDALLGEQRSHVRRAVAGLGADQREAVELAFYGGMSHSEIAQTLNQPLGTVKSRIRGGLIHLRNALRSLHGSTE